MQHVLGDADVVVREPERPGTVVPGARRLAEDQPEGEHHVARDEEPPQGRVDRPLRLALDGVARTCTPQEHAGERQLPQVPGEQEAEVARRLEERKDRPDGQRPEGEAAKPPRAPRLPGADGQQETHHEEHAPALRLVDRRGVPREADGRPGRTADEPGEGDVPGLVEERSQQPAHEPQRGRQGEQQGDEDPGTEVDPAHGHPDGVTRRGQGGGRGPQVGRQPERIVLGPHEQHPAERAGGRMLVVRVSALGAGSGHGTPPIGRGRARASARPPHEVAEPAPRSRLAVPAPPALRPGGRRSRPVAARGGRAGPRCRPSAPRRSGAACRPRAGSA